MTMSSKSLSACALFVVPCLCSTKTRCNEKSANNIRRRRGHSSGPTIFVALRRLTVVGVHGRPLSAIDFLNWRIGVTFLCRKELLHF
jgi:hypothetical protein